MNAKMVSTLLTFFLTFSMVAGYPSCWPFGNQENCAKQPWKPWNPSHSYAIARSPCPALNALANEGFLPYSGRNITIDMAMDAFLTGMNFSPDVIYSFAAASVAQCSNITRTNCTSFDLDMLNVPHAAEHDGSLSRGDFNYGRGNNHDFSPAVWDQVMDLWGEAEIIDFSLAESARVMRFDVANKTDLPGWFLPVNMQSLGESSFYLTAFGDPVKGNARKDWVHYFFSEERFPYALGWNATQRQLITAPLLYAVIAQLAQAKVSY